MSNFITIRKRINERLAIEIVLIFVKSEQDIKTNTKAIKNLLAEDAILWFAYPKGSSKKYQVNINRDNGWEVLKK